jgi:hypothetical protein
MILLTQTLKSLKKFTIMFLMTIAMTHFLFNMLLGCIGNFCKQEIVFQVCMWFGMVATLVNSKVLELGNLYVITPC